MLLVVIAVFTIFFVLPGGPGYRRTETAYSPVAVLLAGKRVQDRAYMERLQDQLNLGLPLWDQFTGYVGNVIRGDLGYEYTRNAPVARVVLSSMQPSIALAGGAGAIWMTAAILSGSVAARRRGSPFDRRMRVTAMMSITVPVFVTGTCALFILSNHGLYSFASYEPPFENPRRFVGAMWAPWLVLAFSFYGIYFRLLRSSVLSVQNEDYIRTAEAKGLSEKGVRRHVLRASLMDAISLFGIHAGVLMGGVILVEPIFGIPGLGSLVVGGLFGLNFPLIAGAALIGSVFVIAASVIVDIIYAWLDPRVSLSARWNRP